MHRFGTLGYNPTPSQEVSNLSSGFVGVQVPGTLARVAVIRTGSSDCNNVAFTTTHTNNGDYLVSGLAPATYTVRRNGSVLASIPVYAGESALSFSAIGGSFEITQGGPAPLQVLTSSLPDGTQGQPYSAVLVLTGGTAPYSWAVTAGSLPSGLALTPAGELTGTPQVAGTFQLTLSVTDASSVVALRDYTLEVQSTVVIPTVLDIDVQSAGRDILIQYGKAGLAAQTPCDVQVNSSGMTADIVFSTTDNGGLARRYQLVTGLNPNAAYMASVSCSGSSGSVNFFTEVPAPPRNIAFPVHLKAPAGLVASFVRIEMGSSTANLAQVAQAACSGSCAVEFSAPSRAIRFIRYSWLDGAGNLLRSSVPIPVLIP